MKERKKIINTIFVIMMCIFTLSLSAYATEDNDIVEQSEVVDAVGEEVINVEGEIQEEISDESEDAFEKIIPIIRKGEEGNVMQLLGISEDETPEIVIDSVYAEEFYADCETFKIRLYSDKLKDARTKLKISVVDENETVVAQQIAVRYGNDIEYDMELIEEVSGDLNYYVRFSYSGNYTIELPSYASISVKTDVVIKDIKLIDEDTNAFAIYLANANPGEEYTLFYGDEYDITNNRVDAIVESGNVIFATFGSDIAFNDDYEIVLCTKDAQDPSDYSTVIDRRNIYNFIDIDSNGYYRGSCTKVNSTDVDYLLFRQYGKFDNTEFEQEDLKNVDAYLFDTTTGKTVGKLTDKELQASNQIIGKIEITGKINEAHDYIVVYNDGYSLGVIEDIEFTSEARVTGIFVSEEYNNYYTKDLPVGATEIYLFINGCNLDGEKIDITFSDSQGNVLKTTEYNKNKPLKFSEPLAEGEYIIKSTCNGIEYSNAIEVYATYEYTSQYVSSGYRYNGKTYILMTFSDKSLDPENLTYKIVKEDGTEYDAQFHRLFDNNGYYRFVIVVDSEINGMHSIVEIYNEGAFIPPENENSMELSYSNTYGTEGFIYDSDFKSIAENGDIILYGEELDETKKYTLISYDELTEKYIEIEAIKVTENSLTFSKKSLETLNYFASIRSANSRSWKYNLEMDNTYFGGGFFGSWGEGDYGTVLPIYSFGFQKAYTDSMYNVLDLPFGDYAYYRLGSTPEEVAEASYKKIEVGLLYKISNNDGKYTVYGQFKTADGQESEVQASTITIDRVAPVFEITSEGPFNYEIDEYSSFSLKLNYTASEKGALNIVFYGENGNEIDRYYNVVNLSPAKDQFRYSVREWGGDDYTKVVKIGFYLEDKTGNKSEEQMIDVKVIRRYIEYDSNGVYLLFDSQTGMISDVESDNNEIFIPSKINGISVTGIDERTFYYVNDGARIVIPESVTNINESAFSRWNDYTLLVYEYSTAHQFAVDNEFNFEIITYPSGDLDKDGIVKMNDVVFMFKHLMSPDDYPYNDSCDVNNDGKENMQDTVYLFKHMMDPETYPLN